MAGRTRRLRGDSMKIVMATKNKGKILELRAALAHLNAEIVSLSEFGDIEDAVEDGKTFAENALIKAKYYMEKTGLPCIADDSGLEVAALGGEPGVYSARYSGIHADDAANNKKLVTELKKKNLTESAADYRCALVFIATDGKYILTEGRVDGRVKLNPKGTNGFGYDPYFYTAEYEGRTMAELTVAEKEKISHRGKAVQKMVKCLEEYMK